MEPAIDDPTVHDETVTSAHNGSGELSIRLASVFHSVMCAETPGLHVVISLLSRESHSSMVSCRVGGGGVRLRRLIG